MSRKWISILSLAAILAILAMPFVAIPAFASNIETLRPDSAGDVTQLSPYPADSINYNKVNEASSDSDSTYVYTTINGKYDLYSVANHSTGSGTINSITVYINAKYVSIAATARIKIKTESTEYDNGSDISLTSSYADYSKTWTTNPHGGSWTWTQIDALQIGIIFPTAGLTPRCTQVYVTIDYTPPPTITTTTGATNLTNTAARLNGNVTDTGGNNPTVLVFWGDNDGGTTPANWDNNPGTAPTSPGQPQGVAAFYLDVSGLTPGTQYFYSAAGTNTGGTSWGTTQTFTTKGPPSVTTSAANNVEETTATLNGSVTSINNGSCSARGFDWDINTGVPYTYNWYETGSFGAVAFDYNVTLPTKGELYYFRAYATNTYGTSSGSELTFLTKPDEPSSLVGTASGTQVDLTWNKETGAQKTYIRGEMDSYPTDRADGYEVYNDTGTTASDVGLTQGHTYYYRAWSYATEGGLEQYSDTYSQSYAYVSLDLVVWWQPESMIVTTALPDLEGADQPGTIFWGTNPNDIDTVLGSLLPSTLPEPGTMGTAESLDVLPEITQPGWFNTSNLEGNPLYPIIALASEYTHFTIWQIWIVLATLVLLIVAGLSFGYLKHMLIAVFLTTACAALFVALGVYPWWVLIIFGFVDLALIVYERKSVI